jgi:hypothetical protein
MSLIHNIIAWYMKQRIPQIEQFVAHPDRTQEEMLSGLLEAAKDTEWGRKYDYASIRNIGQYKERVPVHNYDSLKPWIDRLLQGEQGLLWPSDIRWFAKSSGTTSDKSKFIPVSQEALDECHFKAGRDVMALYCNNNPNTNVFSGRGVMMGGSTQVNKLNENAQFGDVSAVLMRNMPLLAHLIKTPSLKVTLIEDYEEKIEMMARETMKRNITHIMGVPTWTVVLIKRIFELTGKDNLADIWPNLELYIHGGVSFTPYREQFKQLIRKEGMNYLETYNASEGFFGIQHSLHNSDMLLMLDYGIFYEFMPIEEYGKDNPKTVQLSQVEPGRNYALIISTNSGLWRYLIGDTITFTSTYPFRIRVSGRTKFFINAFGEEVIVDNSDKAIEAACHQTGATVKDYTAGPIYFNGNEAGGHEWIIEFDHKPDDPEKFTRLLDNALKELNSDYEAKRKGDMALRMPTVHVAPEGLFYSWLKSKGKLGGQHKVPRLSNDRKLLEELLGMIK